MRLPRELMMAQADDMRGRILQLCNTKPRTMNELCTALDIGSKRCDHYLNNLRAKRKLFSRQIGRYLHFMTPQLFQAKYPHDVLPGDDPDTLTPVVHAPGHGADWTPTMQEVTVDGHVVQRWSSPPSRWASPLPPGGGAISQDHQLRREGWQVGSQWTGYLDTQPGAL
jgi:hypothetical protein